MTEPIKLRGNWHRRTISKRGTIRLANHTWTSRADASRFAGKRGLFAVYRNGEGIEPYCYLWGIEDENGDPNAYLVEDEDGYYRWAWWNVIS